MPILVTDLGAGTSQLCKRLSRLGQGITVIGLEPAESREAIGTLDTLKKPDPLLVVTATPPADPSHLDRLGATVMFPGRFESPCMARHRIPDSLLLPGAVVGPLFGAPRRVDRRWVGLLRAAGIRAGCHPDMQAWLRVTSSWMAPIRGAVVAAAQRGLPLAEAADLLRVATRAARENLRALRADMFDFDPCSACLLGLPEWWAMQAIQSIAATLAANSDQPWLPGPEEALHVGQFVRRLARRHQIECPSAALLDELVTKPLNPRADGPPVRFAQTRSATSTSQLRACDVKDLHPAAVDERTEG